MAETGTASEASRARVFISYAREDGAFASRLALILNDRGFEAVIDREDVDAAEAWKTRVRQLIQTSDLAIVILTGASAALDSVRWEADLAAGSGKRIIVVVPAPLEDGIALPPPLSSSAWFHFYQHPTRSDSGIHAGPALENALKADLAWRRQYTSLFLLAEKWKHNQRADEMLLRGDALAAALGWRESIPRGPALVPVVADFLGASEQAEAHRVVPAGAFESRLLHLEERRAAAQEAARAKQAAAAQARREDAAPAPVRVLTPTQLANLPLAPVQAPSSLQPSQPAGDSVRDDASPEEDTPRRKSRRARGKGLVAPALIAVLMFAGAGAVVWQIVPQYLTSRVAAADPLAAAPISDAALLPPANPTEPEAPTVALADTFKPAPAPPKVSPEPAPPVQRAAEPAASKPTAAKPTPPEPAAPKPAAAKPAPEPAAAEPAPAKGRSPEEADWLAAREIGNVAAFRTYMLKWPKGERYDQALSAARKRIKTLSTKPESVAVLLSGPVVYRELPTFRDKGAAEGAAGQVVNFADRIASPVEGDWLVLERDGAWPFRFVSVRDLESGKQQ